MMVSWSVFLNFSDSALLNLTVNAFGLAAGFT